jgi:hypothetical protein
VLFPGRHMPQRTATERRARDAAYAKWAATETERVRRQRTYLTALKGRLRDGLVRRMLDRAWDLLDAGEPEAADALLEFAPEPEATALLNEYFGDAP